MKFHSVLAASALALGVAVGAAPVKASTVTETISFADTGTYATNGDPVYGYNYISLNPFLALSAISPTR